MCIAPSYHSGHEPSRRRKKARWEARANVGKSDVSSLCRVGREKSVKACPVSDGRLSRPQEDHAEAFYTPVTWVMVVDQVNHHEA